MKISVIHPSRERPQQMFKTMTSWQFKASSNYFIEWILSVDYSDPCLNEMQHYFDVMRSYFLDQGQGHNMKLVINDNKSAIEAINNAAKITSGDLIVVISDDFACCSQWDYKLIDELAGKSDFVVKTIDGLQPTLITLPIMDRIYYERYGYVYYPDYRHMFADQELTAVALMTGKFIRLPITFEHLHYSTGKSPKDEVNIKNDLTWKQGETLFNERLKTNFGITEPVMQYSEIQWR